MDFLWCTSCEVFIGYNGLTESTYHDLNCEFINNNKLKNECLKCIDKYTNERYNH